MEEFEALRHAWYNDDDVLFELINCMKYRESVFLDLDGVATIRCIKANMIRYLQANIQRFKFLERRMNLYNSLAHYPKLPMFSFNAMQRRQQQDKFNRDYLTYMTGYDFCFDIDNEIIEKAYATTYKIKQILDKYKIRYHLLFSGNKGFHIKVSFGDFPAWMIIMPMPQLCKLLKKFAENFSIVHNLTDIDIRIFDLRRIAKTPYSIVYPNYFIALPLSDDEFENFKLSDVALPVLYNQIGSKIRRRGLLTRNGNINGFGKLVKEYTNA